MRGTVKKAITNNAAITITKIDLADVARYNSPMSIPQLASCPVASWFFVAALARRTDVNQARAERDRFVALLETLSQREREVLDGLVEGRANKVIAFDLGISARTVEVYRANVMTKMKAGSLSELVRMVTIAKLL